MNRNSILGLFALALFVSLSACGDTETIEEPVTDAPSLSSSSSGNVFGAADDDSPLPADEVFFPDVFAEDDGSISIGFRMLPGYYIYRDRISARSLSDGVEIGAPEYPEGDIVNDDWFGEQVVFFNDVLANAEVTRPGTDARTVEVEVSYQGCKKDELCYLPVSKVISVELTAQVDSAE